jgi:hypothetical protein
MGMGGNLIEGLDLGSESEYNTYNGRFGGNQGKES